MVKMKKKGQMEMIGLVIIIILITLGMLFMAQFALKGESKKKIFTQKGLAYSTMGALMKLSVDCEDYDSSGVYLGKKRLSLQNYLLADCADNYPGYKDGSSSSSRHNCREQHACLFLQNLIPGLLDQTLKAWGRHYEFRSTLIYGGLGESESSQKEELFHFRDKNEQGEEIGCLGRPVDADSSGLFPLNVEGGLVESLLYVCD